jgi:hypothetical protein
MEIEMSRWVSIAAMTLAFGFVTAPVSAAPTGSVGLEAADRSSIAEQVGYRSCRWYNGRKHCRWVEGFGYGPSVGVYIGDGDRRDHRRGRHRD